jgi:hypothetical protein
MNSRRTILSILAVVILVGAVVTYLLVRSPDPKARLIGPGGNSVAIPNTVPGKSYPTDAGGLCVKGGGTATILSVRAPAASPNVRVTGYSFYRDNPSRTGDSHDYRGHKISIACNSSDSDVHIMVHVVRTGRAPEGRTSGYEVRYRLAGAVHVVDMGSGALLCPGELNDDVTPVTCRS